MRVREVQARKESGQRSLGSKDTSPGLPPSQARNPFSKSSCLKGPMDSVHTSSRML